MRSRSSAATTAPQCGSASSARERGLVVRRDVEMERLGRVRVRPAPGRSSASAVVTPLPGSPATSRLPPAGSHATGDSRWCSGSSASANAAAYGDEIVERDDVGERVGPWSRRVGSPGSPVGGVDGLDELREVGRRRVVGHRHRRAAGRVPACDLDGGRPRGGAATADVRGLQDLPRRRCRCAARRDPGRWRGRCAASSHATTSRESAGSTTRSAIRRFVFVRIESLTAPAGRCVASTRCTPRLRPRCAMSTSASTKSGSSATSVANSSTTTTRRGSGSSDRSSRPRPHVLRHVTRAGRPQHPLAPPELRFEAPQGTRGEVLVEVGHRSHDVGECREPVEGRAAFEVDQDEVAMVGVRGRRPAPRRASAAARSCPNLSCRR